MKRKKCPNSDPCKNTCIKRGYVCKEPLAPKVGTALSDQVTYIAGVSVILGRFNLPHEGHVSLIKEALKLSPKVEVGLSVSKNNQTAGDFDLRVKAFESLLNENEIGKVKFFPWENLFALEGHADKLLIMGDDNSNVAQALIKSGRFRQYRSPPKIPGKSSTNIRGEIDKGIFQSDNATYEKLIQTLRQQEVDRSSSTK